MNDSALRHRDKLLALITAAKAVPCVDCGKSYPHYVMDLDHVRGNKAFHLSETWTRRRSEESVLAEIAKCDPVCANCHRERTFSRRNTK